MGIFKTKRQIESANKALQEAKGEPNLGHSNLVNAVGGKANKLLKVDPDLYPEKFIEHVSQVCRIFTSSAKKEPHTLSAMEKALKYIVNYYDKNNEKINRELGFNEFTGLVDSFTSLHRDATSEQKSQAEKLLNKVMLYALNSEIFQDIGQNSLQLNFLKQLTGHIGEEKISLDTKKTVVSIFLKFVSKLDDKFINGISSHELDNVINAIQKVFDIVEQHKSTFAPDLDLAPAQSLLDKTIKQKEFEAEEKKRKEELAEQKRGMYALKIMPGQQTTKSDERSLKELAQEVVDKKNKATEEEQETQRKKAAEALSKKVVEYAEGQIIARFQVNETQSISISQNVVDSVKGTEWWDDKIIRMECEKLHQETKDQGVYFFADPFLIKSVVELSAKKDVTKNTQVGQSGEVKKQNEEKSKEQEIDSEEKQTNTAISKPIEESEQTKEKTEVQKSADDNEKTLLKKHQELIQEEIKGKKILAFPMHVSGNHWVAVFIDLRKPKNPKVVYCSSLQNFAYEREAKENIREVIKWLGLKPESSLFQKMFRDEYNAIEGFRFVNKRDVPQQANTSDCGPFTKSFLKEVRDLFLKNPEFHFQELTKMTLNANQVREDTSSELEPLIAAYKPTVHDQGIPPDVKERIADAYSQQTEITVQSDQIINARIGKARIKAYVSYVEGGDIFAHPDYVKPTNGNKDYKFRFEHVGEMREENPHPTDNLSTFRIPVRDESRGADSDLDHIVPGNMITISKHNEHEDTVLVEVDCVRRVKKGDSIHRPFDVREDSSGREYIRVRLLDPNKGSDAQNSETDKSYVALYESDFKSFFKNKGRAWEDMVRLAKKPEGERKPDERGLLILRADKYSKDDSDISETKKHTIEKRKSWGYS